MNEYNITQKEIEDGKGLGGLAYITWIGTLIAYLTGKENRYVLYHVQQGIVLILAFVLVAIPILGWIWGLFCLVLFVIGIINGFSGKVQPLPLIGNIGLKFNLVKPDGSTQTPGSQTPPPPPPPPAS